MSYIGGKPARNTLQTADIANGIVTADKVAADVATQAELDAKVPSQSGHSGKYLTTDATNSSWQGVNPANISSGVLPVGVTGGSGLTAVSATNITSGVLPVGVTGGSGLTSIPATSLTGSIDTARLWSGLLIKHQQFKSITGQDFTGTAEGIYTSLGNPMVFAKLKDVSTSKLIFISYGKMFDAAAASLSIAFKLRQGNSTAGTIVGQCDAYDLFHSNSTPPRTGRDVNMYTDEVTYLGVGNHNFVITGKRNGYSDPQAISAWQLHIIEVLI